MITLEGVNDALYVLESARLSEQKLGQAQTWFEVIKDNVQIFGDDHLIEAVKSLAKRRTEEGKDWYVTPGDLIAELMRNHLSH